MMDDSTMQKILDNVVKAAYLTTDFRGNGQVRSAIDDLRTGNYKMAAMKLNAISRDDGSDLDIHIETAINLIKKAVMQ